MDISSRVLSCRVNFSGQQVVVVHTPELVEDLLSAGFKAGLFGKGSGTFAAFSPFLGRGIFTSNGERWKGQRDFASYLFHGTNLKQYLDIFNTETNNLVSVLLSKKTHDIQNLFFRLTLETFGQIGFGVKLDSFQTETHFQKV